MSGFAIDDGISGGGGTTDDTDNTSTDTSTDSDDSDGGIEYEDPRSNPDNWDGDTEDGGEDDTSWDDIDFSDDGSGGTGGIVPDEENDVTVGEYAIPDELRADDGETLREAIGGYLGIDAESMDVVTMEQMTRLRNAVIDYNTGDDADAAAAEFTEAAQAITETAESGEAPAEGDQGAEQPSGPEGLPPELMALLSGDRTTSVGGQEVPTVGLAAAAIGVGYALLGGD